MSALDGVRVIDLTRVLGGPFCTQWLGDHGADVIKIEPPQGDDVRHWGPPFHEEFGASSYFAGINRNKRGMALDLRQEAGKEALFKLLETADILIENFKPGSMEKWGMGYEEVLSRRFPRLIHSKVSGFGADGPMGGLPGYDAVIQAQAGMMSVNGVPGGGPTRLGIAIVDMATGMAAAIGIGMALYERSVSGKGQFIETSLYDTGVSLLFPHYANYFLSGKTPVRSRGTATRTCPPMIQLSNEDLRRLYRRRQRGSIQTPLQRAGRARKWPNDPTFSQQCRAASRNQEELRAQVCTADGRMGWRGTGGNPDEERRACRSCPYRARGHGSAAHAAS